MSNIFCYPFSNSKERYEITSKLREVNQRYSAMDGFIYVEQYIGNDEMRTGKLIWEYKQAN